MGFISNILYTIFSSILIVLLAALCLPILIGELLVSLVQGKNDEEYDEIMNTRDSLSDLADACDQACIDHKQEMIGLGDAIDDYTEYLNKYIESLDRKPTFNYWNC